MVIEKKSKITEAHTYTHKNFFTPSEQMQIKSKNKVETKNYNKLKNV